MNESLSISAEVTDKRTRYELLYPQLEALIDGEDDLIANLSNIVAALKYSMNFFWIGFYFVKGQDLTLGPFQGPVACSRIGFGKGVCGACWKREETIIVPDVDKFPGHIACSADSRSEIVTPVFKKGKVVLILDVDSEKLNNFDEVDKNYLEKIANLVAGKIA
ncbi:MAG: GAF domain-containing protein [Bacteroidia bacterium]